MDELDRRLGDLAALPPPAALATIQEQVWVGIGEARRDRHQIARLALSAAGMALLIGVVTGTHVDAPAPVRLFDSALTPSSLLTASL